MSTASRLSAVDIQDQLPPSGSDLVHKSGVHLVNPDWIGKVISKIGESAGIVVLPEAGDVPAKYARAHDLRRSCADRLVAADVPDLEVAAVMRHASVQTTRRHYTQGNVLRSAGIIREKLAAERT